MSVEQLSEQLRMVNDRQGALETALIQEQQAGFEAERRLGVALGEVGSRADAAVAAATAGAASSPVGASSSSMAGCLDTRLLGKPDRFDGQESCWRDWKFITKAYIEAAVPDIRTLVIKAEETTDDVRNVVLIAAEQALSAQVFNPRTRDLSGLGFVELQQGHVFTTCW